MSFILYIRYKSTFILRLRVESEGWTTWTELIGYITYCQVTPIYDLIGSVDWYSYMCMWEHLSPSMRRVGDLVGVQDGFLTKAVQGRIRKNTFEHRRLLALHKRFYTALILHDLVNEMSLSKACQKYKCTRGVLQSLQQSAATFAGKNIW